MENNRDSVHLFTRKGLHLVLDVESNSLHIVDEPAARAISMLTEGVAERDCRAALAEEFGLETMNEIFAEISELVEEGQLFSSPPSFTGRPAEKRLKALCLFVAGDCNLRCRYCFAGGGETGELSPFMSLKTGQAAIDFLLKQSGKQRYCQVDYFGGEPLLAFEDVQRLTVYGRQKAQSQGKVIDFTLTTNATLLTKEQAVFLRQENFQVILSLDGRPGVHNSMRPYPRGEGSYWAALKGARLFLEHSGGNDYYVRGTYTAANPAFAEDVKHLLDLGFEYISMEPVVAPPGTSYALTEEHLSEISRQYGILADLYLQRRGQGKPFTFYHFNVDLEEGPCLYKRLSGCGAGKEYLAVSPEGFLYPCHQFVGRKSFRLGHVAAGSCRPPDEERFPPAGPHTDSCSKCWARYYCGGGCRAGSYFVHGDAARPYALGCALQKERLEWALYLKAAQAAPHKFYEKGGASA